MLDADLKTQLKGYLERIAHPIALVASVDDGEASGEMTALLRDVAEQSERVTLVRSDGVDTGERTPSFRIERTGTDIGVRFAALPSGHEFTSLVLALLQVGGYRRSSTRTSSSGSARSKANSASRPTCR